MGMREPAMPASRTDRFSGTSTSRVRASNCSERLRTKRGQCPDPGISSWRLESIWQPLQMPRAKVSERSKNA